MNADNNIRKCITILIEMKRNLGLYREVYNTEYTGDLNLELVDLTDTNDMKSVKFGYSSSSDKYHITTIFDNKKTESSVSDKALPVSTIVNLLKLFEDVHIYWKAFEAFHEQQEAILSLIPLDRIIKRLCDYARKCNKPISLVSNGMESLLEYSKESNKFEYSSGNCIIRLADSEELEKILYTEGFSYYTIYTQVFYNTDY